MFKALSKEIIRHALIVILVFPSLSFAELKLDSWHTFSDTFKKGSRVESAMAANPLSGVYFHLYKSEAPKGGPYPYAGVSYQKQNSTPYVLSDSSIHLTYKSKGKLQLLLQQEGVPAGEEFFVTLSESTEYQTIEVLLSDFSQPSWVNNKTELKKHLLTAIKFQLPGNDSADSELWVKNLLVSKANNQEFITELNWQLLNVDSMGFDVKRHENGVVVFNDSLYLIGGRSSVGEVKSSLKLSLTKMLWSEVAKPPVDMHHITPIAYKEKIYVVTGYSGQCCYEEPLTHIYIYDTKSDSWSRGKKIPEAFQRGAAAITLFEGALYVAGGLVGGHHHQGVNALRKFDRYDLMTDEWKHLTQMPRPRDHFGGLIVGTDLYYLGGRDSSAADNSRTVKEVDVYDMVKGLWRTLPQISDLPLPRSGSAYLFDKGKIYVIGGEALDTVFSQTSIFNIETQKWSRSADLLSPRHGTQAVMYDGKALVASGAINVQIDESESIEWMPLD